MTTAFDFDAQDVAIGQRIRQYREARRITQARLAEKIGVTFQQVQKYERGVNRVAASRLRLIALTLGRTPNDFFPDLDASRDDQALPMADYDLRSLQPGDIVRGLGSGASYVVTANYGDHAIGVRTTDIANPTEWTLVSKGGAGR